MLTHLFHQHPFPLKPEINIKFPILIFHNIKFSCSKSDSQMQFYLVNVINQQHV